MSIAKLKIELRRTMKAREAVESLLAVIEANDDHGDPINILIQTLTNTKRYLTVHEDVLLDEIDEVKRN